MKVPGKEELSDWKIHNIWNWIPQFLEVNFRNFGHMSAPDFHGFRGLPSCSAYSV